MMTLTLTLGIAGIMAWAIWRKKYAQAFVLLIPLFGIYSCIAGFWIMNQGNAWPGVLLVALGLGALVYADKYRGKA